MQSGGVMRRASAAPAPPSRGPLSPAPRTPNRQHRSIRRNAYYDPRDPRVIAELRRRQEIQQLQEERRRQLLAAQQRQQAAEAAASDEDDADNEDDDDQNDDDDSPRSRALAAAVQRCSSWRDLLPLAQRYGDALASDARALTLAWRLFEASARRSPPRSRGEAEAASALEEWLRARVLEAAEGARQRLAAARGRESANGNGRQQRQQAAAEAEERRRRQQQQQQQQQQQAAAAEEEARRRQVILEQQQQQEMRRRREQQQQQQQRQEQEEEEERRRRALEAAEAQRRRAQAQRQAQEEEARRAALQRQRERALAMQQMQRQQQRAKQPSQQPQQQRRPSAPPPLPPTLKTLGTKTNLPALKAAAKTLSSPKPSRATLSGCVAVLEDAMDQERERAATARARQQAAALASGNDDPDAAAVAALRRLRADFDNFRARAAREKSQEYGKAAQDACASICFPLLDAWDAAASSLNAKTEGERRVVAQYAQLKDQLLRTLKDEWGVEPVAEAQVGAVFDPETMEGIARDAVSGAAGDGCVSRVFRAGYRAVADSSEDASGASSRLLRPAMVAVASDEV